MRKLLPCFVKLSLLVLLSFSTISAQDKKAPAASDTTVRLLLQAQKLIEENKADEAITLLRGADKSTSSEAEFAYFLGVAYHLKQDYVQAVQQLSVKEDAVGDAAL